MKRLLAAALVLAAPAVACTKENRPPQMDSAAATAPQASGDLAPSTVVAVFNGQNITAGELDQSIRPELDKLRSDYTQQLYKARAQGLDALVIKRLVAAEAKKAGMADDAWLKQQIESKTPPATEAEAKDFFDKNQHMMPPGQSFDALKDKIVGYLTNKKRQDAAVKLFDDLKKQAQVEVKLEEPEAPITHVEAVGPSKGPEGAPVTIVEFSDFQCPFCSRVEPTVSRIMADYAGKVRLVFRDYPLPFHEHAEKAAEASHCAEAQGKYWEMHDAMYGDQGQLDVDGLKKLAKNAGLDEKKFDACLDSGEMKAKVDANQQAGTAAGVNGTPHFFVNGHSLSGAQPYDEFKKVIDHELARVAKK